MKKVENTRSHSWWWDSHVSPKNSKWLQENLSEMDAKVSSMLRIIEEDADSFAQRAEMFYRKRPELINLVEEFYRTYRALVERYTYLTKEIRQNIAPALQAQLGISSESAQNSPVDLHSKRVMDGPDIISPSYSYAGASEFDYDSPSAVSMKGQTDDEFSPLGFRTNFERRAFGLKPTFSNLEDSSPKVSEFELVHGTVDAGSPQLKEELLHLQEENKELIMKAAEEATKTKNTQLELSNLQSRLRILETEDKLTKKRLKSVQEKEQKLEAENLKYCHALIGLKEERTELLEQQKKFAEDTREAYRKHELVEGEREDLRGKLQAAQSQLLESSGILKNNEEVVQKLELALMTLKEERLKDSFLRELYEQQNQDLLKKISDLEKEHGGLLEEASVQASGAQKLREQLADALEKSRVLEQASHTYTQEKNSTEHEKFVALSQVQDLQGKLDEAKKEKEQQALEIARLTELTSKLEEEGLRFLSDKEANAKYVHKLEASLEEGQRLKETLLSRCQHHEDKCKALELNYIETKEKLLTCSHEMAVHQHQVLALEDVVTSSQLQVRDLQEKVSKLVEEKMSMVDEVQNAQENVKVTEGQCAEMHELTESQKEEIVALRKELDIKLRSTRILEQQLLHGANEKATLVEKETKVLVAFQQLECEFTHLKQDLELKLTAIEGMNHKLACLERDKSELVLERQKLQENLLELQTVNAVLSSNYSTSNEHLQAAEKEVRDKQEKLACSLLEVEKLTKDSHTKGELLEKTKRDLKKLETELARYTEANRLLSTEFSECSKNLAAIEMENTELKSRLSDAVFLSTALTEQVSEKERSLKQSTQELLAAQRHMAALNEDMASKMIQTLDLQQQIRSLEEHLKLVCVELLESSLVKHSLEAAVEELQHENTETQFVSKALGHEQQKLSSEILTLKSLSQDLEASLSQAKREKASLQEDATTLANQYNNLKKRMASLESDFTAAQNESAMLKRQLAESEREIMSFSKKLFKSEGRVQDLQLKLSHMLAEEASLTEHLAERIVKIRILETAALDLEKENKVLSEDIGLLNGQVSALKTQEASYLKEMLESSGLIQCLTAEQQRLQQVVLNAEETERRLSLEQSKVLEEHLLLQQKIDRLQQDLEICLEEKAIFSKDAANHFERSTELECELQKLEAAYDLLQQESLKAQQVEHKLKEDLENLVEERQQLSAMISFQREKIGKQEDDLQNLQGVISHTEEDQKILVDKLNLLAVEKASSLEELKKECLKLQSDINHLKEVTDSTKAEHSSTLRELKILQETTSALQHAKSELEWKLECSLKQALLQEDKEKTALQMLNSAQGENTKLEVNLVDAQKRILETKEESDRYKKACGALKEELAAVVMAKEKLEHELVDLQDKNTACYLKLDKITLDYSCLQKQKVQSDLVLEAAVLQGQENASQLTCLQEQLESARDLNFEMIKRHSELTRDWVATEEKLHQEILQLTSASLQQKDELKVQNTQVLKLKGEPGQVQPEKEVLQIDKVTLDLQQQVGVLKTQLSKLLEFSELSAEAEMMLRKENTSAELQRQVKLFLEDDLEQLSEKMVTSDRDLMQMKSNSNTLEISSVELKERFCESQSESKLKQLPCQVRVKETLGSKEQTEVTENTRVGPIVSHEALLVDKLQEEVSNLKSGRQGLESVIDLLKGQLEEAEKARDELLSDLQDCSNEFLQVIGRLEDLDKTLCDNLDLEGRCDHAMLEESSTCYYKEQVDLLQMVVFRPESREPSKFKETSSSSSWRFEQRYFDVMANKIDRMKKLVLLLLNRCQQAQIPTPTKGHQEQVTKSQEEIKHLILEVDLYKEATFQLRNLLEGENLEEEGEVSHEVLPAMVQKLNDILIMSDMKVRQLKEDSQMELEKRRSLQLMLSDLEVKGHSYMLLLKKSFLICCKRLNELASEWTERACDGCQNDLMSICTEKLSRAATLCNGSDAEGEVIDSSLEEKICLRPEAPLLPDTFLLRQLQRRVEEFGLLSEAVENMVLPMCLQYQNMDGSKQGACGTFKESKGHGLMRENYDPHLYLKQHRQFETSTEKASNDIESDIEMADSAGANTPKGDGSEIVETVCLEQKEIELIEGLAQLRINLGMRLHQALMDEKLENELQELKEEREKLKDDLQAQVEQVKRMEEELEKLQVFLKEGTVEGEVSDPRQQQQWRKKRAEKRVRKLCKELDLRRQHVGKMQRTVVAWAEQQELATEILEKQVLFLISKECAPTMEEWDAQQVTQLMQDMHSRKALARRHSMDLQSVQEDLQRVGSSIESTQRQLLNEDLQLRQAASQPANAAPDVVKSHGKPSKLGLTWFLLRFSTRGRRRASSRRRNLNGVTSATTAGPRNQQAQTHQTSSIIALTTFMSQARKMQCCSGGCSRGSNELIKPASVHGKE